MEDKEHGSCGPGLSRRSFLTMAGAVGVGALLCSHAPQVAAAIENSSTKLVWLKGAGCGGCTASFLNGGNPEILSALGKIKLDLAYHEGLMAQQGIFVEGVAENTEAYNSILKLRNIINNEKYILVVEGAILNGPDGTGKYSMIGGRPFKDIFKDAASGASGILAVGTCASFGGISKASGSDIDARGVGYTGTSRIKGMLGELGINNKVVNVPGCPAHPDWILLTLADMIMDADMELDMYHRPKAFFGDSSVHDSCPRRGYFDRAERDTGFAGGKCLYEMGCKGPLAHADCPVRRWNGGVNMCTQSGGPCIACVEPEFPDAFSPFFSKAENREIFSGIDVNTGAKIILGASVLGAGIHAIKRLAIGESYRDELDSREKKKDDMKRRP
ncbi:oxidoreductase [Methanocella sp. CWC-04]|uniref:Oxidoreductase n=1 Tax=Methanooceanicella nereidis TaxID=2052831 RepID=A0AAP2RF94_9EURY|nr:hydrogenase small subunit [Methanocella sp. CWC-04]MCD1296268.1 oxidoreductase [Methanocella sp. CWC-04]